MRKLRELARKTPVLPYLYRTFRNRYVRRRPNPQNTEQVFTEIYRRNKWNGKESVSGTGSDVDQTRTIIKELPTIFSDFGVSTVLDIPCGDYYWMNHVSLNDDIDYTGADIVDDLIKRTSRQYGRHGVRFQKLDLIKDQLPKVDLVLCRDCLVHLSFKDIFCSLENICNSQSEYLLTTTFTGRIENIDIKTGQFRVINLQETPFNLPLPLKIINEGCTEGKGAFSDKSLGLWRIDDIRSVLTLG